MVVRLVLVVGGLVWAGRVMFVFCLGFGLGYELGLDFKSIWTGLGPLVVLCVIF